MAAQNNTPTDEQEKPSSGADKAKQQLYAIIGFFKTLFVLPIMCNSEFLNNFTL